MDVPIEDNPPVNSSEYDTVNGVMPQCMVDLMVDEYESDNTTADHMYELLCELAASHKVLLKSRDMALDALDFYGHKMRYVSAKKKPARIMKDAGRIARRTTKKINPPIKTDVEK